MKKKKRLLLFFLCAALLISIAGLCGFVINIRLNCQRLAGVVVVDADLSVIEDGIYEGSYDMFPMYAKVDVTVISHKIVDIKQTHYNKKLSKTDVDLFERVINTGSLNVDKISGATCSSTVMLKAIENALHNAAKH